MSVSRPRFAIGDRVVTGLYGAAVVEVNYSDRNVGWTYTLALDTPIEPGKVSKIQLVEEALELESAVVQLARLARE